MIDFGFKFDQRFKRTVAARYGGYEFRGGILRDKPYQPARSAKFGLTSVAGGPARKQGRKTRGTVAGVGESIRTVLNVPYLTEPFKNPKSKPMRTFLKEFAALCRGERGAAKRAQDAFQEVIREPVRAKRYGQNTAARARVKRFNRKLFDTGQFYLALVAKVLRGKR